MFTFSSEVVNLSQRKTRKTKLVVSGRSQKRGHIIPRLLPPRLPIALQSRPVKRERGWRAICQQCYIEEVPHCMWYNRDSTYILYALG